MAIKSRRAKLYPPINQEYASKLGLDELEWEKIVDRLGRAPNHFECAIFATLWSEEVSNKSASSLLEAIEDKETKTRSVRGSELGLVDIGENNLLSLRVVHNNHQSAREPAYGAQTAIDQSLEELTSVGARPLGILPLMRVGAHDLIRNQRDFQSLTRGVSDFSNRVGTPIISGELVFHERYNRSLMVNSGIVGLLRSEHALGESDSPYGSALLYIGAPTGRDGLPLENTEENPAIPSGERSDGLIKVSDPLLANRLISACAEAVEKGVLREITAVGRGGLAVACFRLASRLNKATLLDIDRVPTRGRKELSPLDIILSESSERLLVATKREHQRELSAIFTKWDIKSLRVGEVNDSDGIEFYWNHYNVADIPFQFALGGAVEKTIEVVKFPPMLKRKDASADSADKARRRKHKVEDEWSLVREVALSKISTEESEFDCPKNLEDVWLDLLANPNLCSRKALYELFDQTVGANTLQGSGADAALLRLPNEAGDGYSDRALAVSIDSNSLYVSMEPYLGTVQSVAEAMRNLAASGARPLGLAHCLNFGNPENYKEICDLAEAIRGLGDASSIWKIPILSEDVSLYNGTDGSPTLPTPAILMAGLIENKDRAIGIGFRKRGDKILLVGMTKNEIGCTEYAHYIHRISNRLVPDIDFDLEKRTCEFIVSAIEDGLLASAHDISAGGTAVAFSECCLSRRRPLGARLHIDNQVFETPNGPVPLRRDAALFAESASRFIISCSPENESEIRSRATEANIPITGEGEVGGKEIRLEGVEELSVPISTTYRLWIHRMEHLLGQREDDGNLM